MSCRPPGGGVCGRGIFYSGFGFTNWPNDVINDIHLGSDGKAEFVCTSDAYRDCLTYFHDWYAEGLMDDIVHTRSFLVGYQQGKIKLRIILNRFSLEVFVNDGAQAASAAIYTRQEAGAITFEAGGSALMDVEKYDLTFDVDK